MATLYNQADKNVRNSYFLGVFLFFFLFVWSVFDFSSPKISIGVNVAKAACPTGFADCDGNSLNGCEADLSTDKNNCGYCGVKCNGACANSQCLKITGGLVPCGRYSDDCTTPIDETAPCGLCALFYMLKNVINFVMTLATGVGVFILVIAGLFYALSAGNPRRIELAKSAAISAIIGIAVVFIAWLAIAVILQGMGYGNMTTWNQVACAMPASTVTCICGDGVRDPELGEVCDGLSGVARSPEESSPSLQYACIGPGLPGACTTTGGYAGDGIVNGPEICDANDPTTNVCSAALAGLPAYCGSILVPGTQTCNSTSTDWGDCVAGPPTLVSNNYGSCSSATTYLTNYACCELTGCQADACCGGANSANATLPGGYTLQGTLPYSGGNCKLGQNGTDWAISINHTTAGFQCWQ